MSPDRSEFPAAVEAPLWEQGFTITRARVLAGTGTVAILALLFALALVTIGERPFIQAAQPSAAPGFEHDLGSTLSAGQSFVSRHSGLAGIELNLSRNEAATSGVLVASLLAAPGAQETLAETHVDVARLPWNGTYPFTFTPVEASRDRSFYLELQAEGLPEGAVIRFTGSDALAYMNGTMYVGGVPQDRQLQFRLVHTGQGLLRDLRALAGHLALVLVATIYLFLLPGYAMLLWLAPALAREWRMALLASPAVGLALHPLLYLWLQPAGIPINRTFVLLFCGAAAILGALGLLRLRGRSAHTVSDVDGAGLWPDVALGGGLLLLLASRFWPVHVLDGPSWGDSVQHAVLAQALVEQQGLLSSWLPYAPYESLTTHYGFSAATALYMLLTGSAVVEGTLVMGQIMNILAVLCLYPLVVLATGNRWAGVASVLIAGLLNPMPQEYVNWGRYAQLSGQVILPVAIFLLWWLLRQPRVEAGLAVVAAATLAGLALCYYRMPVLLVLFFAGWGLIYALPEWRLRWAAWRPRLVQMGITGACSALLMIPWLLNLQNSKLGAGVAEGVAQGTTWENIVLDYRNWLAITSFVPASLLAACVVALVVAGLRPHRWPWLVALWTLLLAGSKATELFHFPLAKYLQTFAVLITLYIPVSLLVGWLVGIVAGYVTARGREVGGAVLCLLLLASGAAGAVERLQVIKPEYVMLTHPDLQAARWIVGNVPVEARFLVNGFTIWGDESVVGSDAGWWLPLLTRRANTMPPQYALLNERPLEADYDARVLDLVIRLREQPLDSPAGFVPLCAEGVTHIYSGQVQGRSGFGAQQLLNPVALEANPALRKIYHRDQVRIFELSPEACGAGASSMLTGAHGS
jgi:hypothetical protein